MKLYIRADANKKIATGHVMRCISIASCLRDRNIESCFIAADKETSAFIEDKGFDVICMDTDYKNPDSELSIIKEIVRKNNVKVMLIDSYFVTYRYLAELSNILNIVYIDDLDEFIYPVQCIINYSFNLNKKIYTDKYRERNTLVLAGTEYTPLNSVFCNIHKEIKERVESIMITTGGSDPYNMSGRLLSYIIENNLFNDIEFNIVSGKMNDNIKVLRSIEKENNNIHIYENINNMSELMKKSDIAVTAGGTTLLELCAANVPVINFSFADNQKSVSEAFGKMKITEYVGDIRNDMRGKLAACCDAINFYKNNFSIRKERSMKMGSFIDGKGSYRIAEIIEKIMDKG